MSKKRKLELIVTETLTTNKRFSIFDTFLYNKSTNNSQELNTLKQFIKSFPNLSKHKDNTLDTLTIEKSLNISSAIMDYYNILKKAIHNYITTTHKEQQAQTQEQTVNEMLTKVKSYISVHLYTKLFPYEQSENDIKIYNQCVMLNAFVKERHFTTLSHVNLSCVVKECVKYINKLDYVKEPYMKMKLFAKVQKGIMKCLSYCVCDGSEVKTKDVKHLLLFVVIKAQPKKLYSNLSYIDMFYFELHDSKYLQLFKVLVNIRDMLCNFKWSILFGVKEEEYKEFCLKYNKEG